MTVTIATKELVDCTGLRAITMYNEAGQFGQHLLAKFPIVHNLHLDRLLHMQQPHQCLLSILVTKSEPSSRYESYCFGL